MRSLSSALRRRIGELAFVYRRTMPDFVSPSADEGYGSFEDGSRGFRAATTRRSPSSFFGPSTTMAACVTLRCSRTPRCARPFVLRLLAQLIFEDPRELTRVLAELLADYWDAAFAAEWIASSRSWPRR